MYDLISVAVDELVAAGPVDSGRPVAEFDKRHDEIELCHGKCLFLKPCQV